MSKNKYLFPLVVMASLFFLFGFITTMNNSTIEFLKDAFGLNDVQKQLPNTFFYGAYILSVPVGFLINKIGYRFSIFTGLGLIAIGFFLLVYQVLDLGITDFLVQCLFLLLVLLFCRLLLLLMLWLLVLKKVLPVV